MLKLVVIQIVVTTLTDSFFFFLQFTVMCWDINLNIHYSWSDLSLLSASDILRYTFCPAECIQYIAIYFVLPSDCDI